MRILHVITSLQIGGAEKLIVDIVPLLSKRAHIVDVLLFNGVETFFKEELQNRGFNIIAFGKDVYNVTYIYKLIPILNQYDIVHTHNTACQYFVAVASLFLHNKPKLVTTEHSTSNKRRTLPFFKYVDRWMYKKYDAIIAISPKAKDNLIDYLEKIFNIYTINNGIEIERYINATPLERRSSYFVSKTDFLVTMVAGFRPQKDQETLIKAFAYLPDEYKLWLVGEGERMYICKKIVVELGLSNRVFFWGIRKDIPRILKASDIVVLSSHCEGFGLAAVEGMAAGKPVVASNVPGLSEVVGGAGVLFEVENSKELATIIEKMKNDKTFYKNISEHCFHRALSFDINIMANKYMSIYLCGER
jgi:glycosyltransferase involved in cell wall biosynthesis